MTDTKNAELEQKIREIMDRDIKPALARDGGAAEFKRFEDGIVYLELQGACAGCPGAQMTLKMGIEAHLKKLIPEVQEVQAVK